MNQKEKILLNETIVVLAFAYSLSGYHLASMGFGFIAILLAISFHSWRYLQKFYMRILYLTLIQLVIIYVLHLHQSLPTLPFLILVNAVCSFLAMDCTEEVIDAVMKIMLPIMLTFVILTMIIPPSILTFFLSGATNGFLDIFAIVCMIFFPFALAYITKERFC